MAHKPVRDIGTVKGQLEHAADMVNFGKEEGFRAGMERAAVLVGVVADVEGEHLRTTIAAAIRAEIKQ